MIYFLDNDILLKLAAFDLLNETIGALDCSRENLRVLETARFVFRSNRKVSAKYSAEIRARAIDFIKDCQTVNPAASPEFIGLSQMLDLGEATLVAATREVSTFVLMTGDKRCLQALAAQVDMMAVRERLQGRIVCLEQVILLLIRDMGFERVLQQVLPAVDCDTALRACFGSGELALERNVIEALEGYVEALRHDAPGLLADMDQF